MLLSFVANEAISRGSTVAVLDTPLGQITNINPEFFSDSRGVGIAIDTVPSGGLCRVVSRGPVGGFSGLIPGAGYFAPIVPGAPVRYAEFVDQFNAIPASGAYLCGVGKAATPTDFLVNLTPPVFVVKDSLN